VWFGVFSVLYGTRLCAKSTLIQAVTPWSESFFHYIDAFIDAAARQPARRDCGRRFGSRRPGRAGRVDGESRHGVGTLRSAGRHSRRDQSRPCRQVRSYLCDGVLYCPRSTADVPFRDGDRLLLFTDGLLEATRGDDGDEFFGDAELDRVVASLPPFADVSEAVLRAHRGWIGSTTPLSDDLTLVVVECVE
jgi:hypothetical protein